jgi:hypothetical protein
VTEWTGGSVTGTLKDFTIEDAVSSLAQAAGASWMRFYMLEAAPPDAPHAAGELLRMLERARRVEVEKVMSEVRAELARGAAPEDLWQRHTGRSGGTMEGPGGAIARQAEGEAGELPLTGAGDGYAIRELAGFDTDTVDDPIRRLMLPGRTDMITCELTDVSLADTISEFVHRTRFFIVADESLTGDVSLELDEAPLSEALDAIAEAADAQWRTVYLISAPRQLSLEEIADQEAMREERREEALNEAGDWFWRQPPERRAEYVQQAVMMMGAFSAAMEGAPSEQREQMGRMAEMALTEGMGYLTQLTPEQRMELKPLLQALTKQNAGE